RHTRFHVTGVQTCALPIWSARPSLREAGGRSVPTSLRGAGGRSVPTSPRGPRPARQAPAWAWGAGSREAGPLAGRRWEAPEASRTEEARGGERGRTRGHAV